MDFQNIAFPGKFPVPYGPAGDLNYQQLFQLQYLAHKPIIKQPICEYKAPRLLKLMCAKNGHRNSDGRCLCNPEKIVPYIREKIQLPSLPSDRELVPSCKDEPDVFSESKISNIDDVEFCYSKDPVDTNRKSSGSFLNLVLEESDEEDNHQELASDDSDISNIEDLKFYFSKDPTETKSKSSGNFLKLALEESDESLHEDNHEAGDQFPSDDSDVSNIDDLEFCYSKDPDIKSKSTGSFLKLALEESDESLQEVNRDETGKFVANDSDVSNVDDLEFCYGKDSSVTKSSGSFLMLALAESDEILQKDNYDRTDQLASDDSDVSDINDLEFFYERSAKQSNSNTTANVVIPKLNLSESDNENILEIIQVNTEKDSDVSPDTNVVPNLNLEAEDNNKDMQFQFDEHGNKIWDYGPDESDSEISVETARRIKDQNRTRRTVNVNGVEIPLLDFGFLEDDKKPEKPSEIKVAEISHSEKAQEPVESHEEPVAEVEAVYSGTSDYEDDFESDSSEQKAGDDYEDGFKSRSSEVKTESELGKHNITTNLVMILVHYHSCTTFNKVKGFKNVKTIICTGATLYYVRCIRTS